MLGRSTEFAAALMKVAIPARKERNSGNRRVMDVCGDLSHPLVDVLSWDKGAGLITSRLG